MEEKELKNRKTNISKILENFSQEFDETFDSNKEYITQRKQIKFLVMVILLLLLLIIFSVFKSSLVNKKEDNGVQEKKFLLYNYPTAFDYLLDNYKAPKDPSIKLSTTRSKSEESENRDYPYIKSLETPKDKVNKIENFYVQQNGDVFTFSNGYKLTVNENNEGLGIKKQYFEYEKRNSKPVIVKVRSKESYGGSKYFMQLYFSDYYSVKIDGFISNEVNKDYYIIGYRDILLYTAKEPKQENGYKIATVYKKEILSTSTDLSIDRIYTFEDGYSIVLNFKKNLSYYSMDNKLSLDSFKVVEKEMDEMLKFEKK